jgi:predicted DNA-binding transcriptional regulator AlpA
MTSEIDSFLGRSKVREMTTLSYPTINRLQRAGRFPKFEQISAGRVGLRKSVLAEFLKGRRDWDIQGSTV